MFVDHGQGHQVVLLHNLHHLFAGVACFYASDFFGVVQVLNGRSCRAGSEQQFADRKPAFELACVVDHINAVHAVHLFSLRAHFSDRLGHGPIHLHSHELCSHQSTRCSFRKTQEVDQLFLVLIFELGEDFFCPRFGQLPHDIGGIVRFNVGQHFLHNLAIGELCHEHLSHIFVEFDKHIGRTLFVVDELEQVADFLGVQMIENLRNVCRVHRIEALH